VSFPFEFILGVGTASTADGSVGVDKPFLGFGLRDEDASTDALDDPYASGGGGNVCSSDLAAGFRTGAYSGLRYVSPDQMETWDLLRARLA
jgi:hypothetical protein